MRLLFATFQSPLHPAGPYARAIERLWWVFFAITAVIYVLMLIGFALAVRKGARRKQADLSDEATRSGARFITIALSATTVILIGLLFTSIATGRDISPVDDKVTREIKITGHQWWWEVQYAEARPDMIVETANELHLPVGERVKLILDSDDVIHSLWIPNLHGKRDLIPGYDGVLTLTADKTGTYRAQCAEFCGLQHAKMAFLVIVEPKADFERWLTAQRLPAPFPKTADQQHGQQVFLTSTCVMCHAIKGTSAGARTGPDLTHLASRRTLGAGILPNTLGNLHGWIANAQTIKPGVLMPPNPLEPNDLHALVAYLETLQ
ncbi:MAG: cytochrome c oxidase subunit II [Acidobacteria bacterium]|nr:cytochrome c oxidase subunit II [Acidobacteriota bacterium]MBV9478898.1 cytochrome c oxidase subunit II [Acidobacteriota bacterium]